MNNRDVFDMLKRTYSDNAPDILHNLTFEGMEKEEIKVIPVRKKYFTAAAIYAAACLVVAISLPFLIGRGEDPTPTPGVSGYNTETAATGDDTRDDRRFAEYDSETETVTETDEIIDSVESVTSNETTTPEETASNDVYPTPVESTEELKEPESETIAPEPEPEPEKKPTIVEPMVSTSKSPVVPETTAPNETTITTEPEPEKPAKVYSDSADHARVRFYKDKDYTEEYTSTADIPRGVTVYYKIESDPGYICTNFKINVYGLHHTTDYIDHIPEHHPCFINNYQGDRLEYSLTTVLAGDSDQNLVYNLKDATTILKYIAGYTTENWTYGPDGYSEILDYTCDGAVNLVDVAKLLQEIADWDVERNSVPYFMYCSRNGIGDSTTLLSLYDPEVLPHGLPLNSILTDGVSYNVYCDTSSISRLSDEIKAKYDDTFFKSYKLVTVYCYTAKGEKPEIDDIKIWYNSNTCYLFPVYADGNASTEKSLSEYAICFAVSKNMNISDNAPV